MSGPPTPETRPSILLRLRDHADRDAWRQFERVYRGVIARVGARHGLQDADIADLTQDVLIRISRHIDGFRHDPDRAKFRTWLGSLIRSALVDQHRKRPADRGGGGDASLRTFGDSIADPSFEADLESDYRGEIFRWAARRVRREYSDVSWRAFWQTTVLGRSIDDVAAEQNRSRGAIYTSRSRIMKRIREEVRNFDDACDPADSSSPTFAPEDGRDVQH